MPKYCEECGTKVSSSEKFCVECGHQLTQDKKNKPTPTTEATTPLDHTLTLQKSYLIFGILSIIIAVALIFGINIINSLIFVSEILIIIGGILLIFAYELIFRKKAMFSLQPLDAYLDVPDHFFPS